MVCSPCLRASVVSYTAILQVDLGAGALLLRFGRRLVRPDFDFGLEPEAGAVEDSISDYLDQGPHVGAGAVALSI